jgi:hypothetical protein
MNTQLCDLQSPNHAFETSVQRKVEDIIDDLLLTLPDQRSLTESARRGIISRYTAVLEGNFIYWMTAAYLSATSKEAHAIVLENLTVEVRDSHPAMLRRFALAARASPTDADFLAVHRELTRVRVFLGRLSSVPTILMMAFFEGFIQRFMMFLAELAAGQGSNELEYTTVHGVCDVTHTQELFKALSAEMALNPIETTNDLFEGVDILRNLIRSILCPQPAAD